MALGCGVTVHTCKDAHVNTHLLLSPPQLSQLDVAIRDHRLDMEKKVLHLQGELEKSQKEVMEREKQVRFHHDADPYVTNVI